MQQPPTRVSVCTHTNTHSGLSLLCPQFRENIRDVLPALPNTDDAFLLRWLRGKPQGRSGTKVKGTWVPVAA